ncbi:MAG: heme lyase CcmF/NrfE family subunit [Anaerolineae bacterium]|nr:heme lyase CcmF/NrfE family subunit [Anaerolineae bacterium]
MIADLGFAVVLIAFLSAIYAAIVSVIGARRNDERWVASARNAAVATFPLLLLASGLLITLLLQGDFSVDYVYQVSSREMPTYLKVTALWGGQAGGLLFWNLLLAAFTATAMLRKWDDQRPLMPYAILVASLTQIFFIGLVAFVENPFSRIPGLIPADGRGLNPLLRHPGMIIHPPMLYLGFTGFTIPYVFAMAALISGKLDEGWIRTTRRWTLVAWLFLSLGLILGGRWAYDVLGWGGYWAWDPVENASFIPWLSGTAFLHSVIIQEKRNMFKGWNMFLVIATYLLVILGTFIVRSGVISSVHSFAQSEIGPLFFGFLGLMIIFSVYWVVHRWDELSTENRLESLLSREAAFLFNNFVFIGILVATLWGTLYPIISELFTNEKVTVGPPFYNKVNGPLFVLLLLLMGIAPLTMWYRSSAQRIGMAIRWPALAALVVVGALIAFGIDSWAALLGLWVVTFSLILTVIEFVKGVRARMKRGESPWAAFSNLMARNRRRYGGYWIHLGVLVMAFGIIGSYFFQQETQIRLRAGESLSLGTYTMTFNGVRQYPGLDDLLIKEANLSITDNGRDVGTLTPRTELYTRSGQPMTIPSLRSTIEEDFYVIMVNWETVLANEATFRVFLNPLINWVWAGGLIFVIGTLIAAWPSPARERVAASARRRIALGPALGGD